MRNISPESVATTFPRPILTPITGHPSYQTLAAIHLKLNANTASVFSNRGDGIHGLLALSVSPEIYQSMTGMVFIPPTNPGLHLTNITTASTSSQIAHATREHEAFCEEWEEYVATDITLKINLSTPLTISILKLCLPV